VQVTMSFARSLNDRGSFVAAACTRAKARQPRVASRGITAGAIGDDYSQDGRRESPGVQASPAKRGLPFPARS
jgi:hypothetical protein